MWLSNSDKIFKYTPFDNSKIIKELPVGIYEIRYDEFGSIYVEKIYEKFKLPSKFYNFYKDIEDRIIKKWNNSSDKNLGVYLYGFQGSGKTISAKNIMNNIELPVICLDDFNDSIYSFINKIDQDVVVFIDEFEKITNKIFDSLEQQSTSSKMLKLLDGGNKLGKCLFLLTSNKNKIEYKYLNDRPSRIRYRIEYGNLSKEQINIIIDDILPKKLLFLKNMIYSYILSIKNITVDNIKEIIDECVVFEQSPYDFKNIFNVQEKNKIVEINYIDNDVYKKIFTTIYNSSYDDDAYGGIDIIINGFGIFDNNIINLLKEKSVEKYYIPDMFTISVYGYGDIRFNVDNIFISNIKMEDNIKTFKLDIKLSYLNEKFLMNERFLDICTLDFKKYFDKINRNDNIEYLTLFIELKDNNFIIKNDSDFSLYNNINNSFKSSPIKQNTGIGRILSTPANL